MILNPLDGHYDLRCKFPQPGRIPDFRACFMAETPGDDDGMAVVQKKLSKKNGGSPMPNMAFLMGQPFGFLLWGTGKIW